MPAHAKALLLKRDNSVEKPHENTEIIQRMLMCLDISPTICTLHDDGIKVNLVMHLLAVI